MSSILLLNRCFADAPLYMSSVAKYIKDPSQQTQIELQPGFKDEKCQGLPIHVACKCAGDPSKSLSI